MKKRTLIVVATALSAAAALIAGLSIAEATRTVRIASHVTIKSDGLTFSGRVTSSNSACGVARKVTLYRTASLKLGSTTASTSGRWKVTVSGFAGITLGHFYAKVAKRSEGAAGTIYVCKAARSKTIRYRP